MSTLSLTTVAVDRYQAVSVSLSPAGGGVTRAVVVVVMINVSAMVATLPYTLHMSWVVDTLTGEETCWEDWAGVWRQVCIRRRPMLRVKSTD